MFHTWHKSFKFAVFCCGGEVVVPSDPPEKQRIKKTAKHWTIIMMRWVEPEQTEWISATCSSVKIVDVCFFLFRFCWLLSYFISFYGSNTCLFSFWNKPPFERKLFYVKVFFNLYFYYHLINHSRMHRHARFVGGLAFSSGVTFRASYYVFMSIRLLMVDLG